MVVTTSRGPSGAIVARATQVAARLGVRYVARQGSLERARTGADFAYIVSRDDERVVSEDTALRVLPGMFDLKREAGRSHPLLRALSPLSGATRVQSVVDGTCGLAGDAIFIAWALDIDVVAIEASPVVACLLEEGLPRLAAVAHRAWARGARRIRLIHGRALEAFSAMPSDAADVVYLDPMFETPAQGTPGFEIFRRFACHDPLTAELLTEAWRVARRRVVVKVRGATPFPEDFGVGPGWNRRVRGQAVDYVVMEGELEAPELELPTLGT